MTDKTDHSKSDESTDTDDNSVAAENQSTAVIAHPDDEAIAQQATEATDELPSATNSSATNRAETDTAIPATKSPATGRGATWRVATALAVIAFLIAMAAGGGIAYLYIELQKTRLANQQTWQLAATRGDQQQAQLEEINTQLSGVKRRLENTQQANNKQVMQLNESIRVLQENGSRSERGWVIAETRYLLKMAVHRVALAGDLDSAAAATRAADAQLHALADVSLLPVRAVLAKEIALLRATPKPDIEGKVFALIQLARRSNTLPLKTNAPGFAVAKESTEDAVDASNAESGVGTDLMQIVKRFVVVKTVLAQPTPVELLDSNAENLSKRAGLQIALQQAQIAVLRRDQGDFIEAVNSAKTLLAENFEAGEPAQRFAEDLALVEQSPVLPKVDGIGEGLKLLDKIEREAEAQS